MSHTILLVEDNPHIMNINCGTLLDAGYSVRTARQLADARRELAAMLPDLLVLDIMLPDGDGIAFCLELRTDGIDIPVLFLTAKGDKDDILEGFRAGGDDYLTKPYDLEIFAARVKALLGRAIPQAQQIVYIRIGNIQLDLGSGRATCGERDLLLTPKEFSLLNQLWRNHGKYTTAIDLYKAVWGMDTIGDVNTVKERIFQLRRKLGENSLVEIKSARGKGYRLTIKQPES